MRKLLFILAVLGCCAWAQGIRFDYTVEATTGQVGSLQQLIVIPGATTYVCSGVFTGTACTSAGVTVYADAALTEPITQPLVSDAIGRITNDSRANGGFYFSSGPIYFTTTPPAGAPAAAGSFTVALPGGGGNIVNLTAQHPAITPTSIEAVEYADQFEGADMGAKINAAIAVCPTGGCRIIIPSGSYTWSTPVTENPAQVSIEGDGINSTTITCASSTLCLRIYENSSQFNILPGGAVGGFTLLSNGAAGQIGIEAGDVQALPLHDIWFENFNGAGSIALKFYNADGNAMERTRATGLMFSGNTIGVEFDYDTAHSLSQSFGYSDWSFNFVNGPGSGQFGVQILHGLLYHSKLHVVGNVDTGGWLMNVAAPGGAGVSQVFDTAFNIYAEGGGNGIEVGSGAEFAGYGNVDLVEVSGTKATNANSAGWTPTFRVSPGAPAVWPGDAGTISNFFGGGQSASFYPLIAPDYSNPYSAFGALTGPNIFSTFTTLYNGAANAFIVYSCPASPASLAACTDKFHADQAGDVNAQGSMTWGGGATIPNSSNVALAGANGLSAGTVTLATGAGSHTFTTAYSAAPTCTATDTTAAVAVQVTSSTTAVTLAGTGTDVIAWQCAPAVN